MSQYLKTIQRNTTVRKRPYMTVHLHWMAVELAGISAALPENPTRVSGRPTRFSAIFPCKRQTSARFPHHHSS
jgi:hypothetical protein